MRFSKVCYSRARSLVLLNSAAFFVLHCTSTQTNLQNQPADHLKLEKKDKTAATPLQKSQESAVLSKGKAQDLYSRLSNSITALSPADREIRNSLSSQNNRNTLDNAVLYLLNVHSILHPLGGTSVVNESPLDDSSTPIASAGSGAISFEDFSQDENFDFVSNFRDNPYLQDKESIAKLTLDAAERGPKDSIISQQLRDLISQRAANWLSLTQKYQLGQNQAPNGETPPEAEASTTPKAPLAMGDLRDSDEVLDIAQQLANQGKLKEANTELSTIGEDSPLYETAQEKVIQYSNQGAAELRQQAAQAFQSAMANFNMTSRKDYLERAKKLLQQALTDFPRTEDKETIEANLVVIERELNK
ncbi:MAG: hypothetical protein KBD78_00135 [Oligoflexales bacterium]|nr:hypothetical protein [Oligoflexales bacterium]